MTTKPRKATTKPATKGAARGRSDRKPDIKGDQLVQLLKARSGCDITGLSGKLGWQPHTTRAALSRLRKTGLAIEKLAPQKNGGSRYRIFGTPAGPVK